MEAGQMISQRDFQSLINNIEKLDYEELSSILQGFSFDNILSVSILDLESIRLHLIFLKKLSQLDMFYTYFETVKFCWDFTVINIWSLEKVSATDVLLSLLELLNNMFSKLKILIEFSSFLNKERERLFEVLMFAVKLRIFTKCHVSIFTKLFIGIIQMEGPLPPSISNNLTDVMEIFKRLGVVFELTIFCDISLNKFGGQPPQLFDVCISWLVTNGPRLFEQDLEEDTVSLLLKLITDLFINYNRMKNQYLEKNIECFLSNLRKVASRIIYLSGNSLLRDASLKLLSVLISQYIFEEFDTREEYSLVLNKLQQLPIDIKKWPQVKLDIYFHVCSFLCKHSRLSWSSLEVLDSLSRLIYSYNRFSMSVRLLRSLCYIYPIIMMDIPATKIHLLVGDELLIILSKFPYSFSKIITFHPTQLHWILGRGCRMVKKQLLVEWLKKDDHSDILENAIVQCKVGSLLLDIIIDWKSGEVANKAAELCHRIEYKKLSENIALLIPSTLHNRSLMGKLILSNPGIPDDVEITIKICEFMSAILCVIDDERVLRAACMYCKNLLTSLRKENNIIPLICRNIPNLRFLAVKVKYVDEETAVAILKLLKVSILIQNRNHNNLPNHVNVDFTLTLSGSANKIENCLDLLQIIVTSKRKHMFIQVEKSKVLNIFLSLLDVSRDSNLAVRSFICLTCILKTNEWLASDHCTIVFIETQCSLSADDRSEAEFFVFLTTWLKILRKSPVTAFYKPNKSIIFNYIIRTRCVSQGRVSNKNNDVYFKCSTNISCSKVLGNVYTGTIKQNKDISTIKSKYLRKQIIIFLFLYFQFYNKVVFKFC